MHPWRQPRRPGAPATYGGAATSAVLTIDAFLDAHGTGSAEGLQWNTKQLRPEQRLVLDLIMTALKDASYIGDDAMKVSDCEEARMWLRNAPAPLTAETCFEALYMDYDAAMKKVEEQWAKSEASKPG